MPIDNQSRLIMFSLIQGFYLGLFVFYCSPNYNISVTQIRVGTTLIDVDFTALFDSGTSFTYLVEPTYARLAESVSM